MGADLAIFQGPGSADGLATLQVHISVIGGELAGEAEGIQVPDATLGGIFNMGGAAVANYVSILERIR